MLNKCIIRLTFSFLFPFLVVFVYLLEERRDKVMSLLQQGSPLWAYMLANVVPPFSSLS